MNNFALNVKNNRQPDPEHSFDSKSSNFRFLKYFFALVFIVVGGHFLVLNSLDIKDKFVANNSPTENNLLTPTPLQDSKATPLVAKASSSKAVEAKNITSSSVIPVNSPSNEVAAAPAGKVTNASINSGKEDTSNINESNIVSSKATSDNDIFNGNGGSFLYALPPQVQTYKVKSGDFLMGILSETRIDPQVLQNIAKAFDDVYSSSKLKIGQEINITFHESKGVRNFVELTMMIDNIDFIKIINNNGTIVSSIQSIPTANEIYFIDTAISSSLYQTAVDKNMPLSAIVKATEILSYEIDFQREVHKGDKLSAVFSAVISEKTNEVIGGKLLMVSLKKNNKSLQYFRFEDSKGGVDFYDIDGKSAKRSIVKTPVNAARISSSFGMRVHPILNFSRMHSGVDFAVPTGTPIYAAGDGVVEFAGRNGGYGNFILLRHAGSYKTAYAHLSRIKKKKGSKVKQGEIIGYSGSTGVSTGPHLHYEVRRENKAINPLTLKLPNSHALKSDSLKSYKVQLANIIGYIPEGHIQLAKSK